MAFRGGEHRSSIGRKKEKWEAEKGRGGPGEKKKYATFTTTNRRGT